MRRSRIAAAVFLLLVGCSSTKSAEKPLDRSPMELKAIPEVPGPAEGSVVPLPDPSEATAEESQCVTKLGVPVDGYVLSQSKYEAAIGLRLALERTHNAATYNSAICTIWNDSTWKQLKRSDELLDDIYDERNGWWYQNKDTVIFGSGFTLGATAAILIVYGVNAAQQNPE